jgi:hypothetical protein
MAGENEKVAELQGQVTDLEKTVDSLTKKLEKARAGGGDTAEMQAQLDAASESLDTATQAIEKLSQERDEALLLAKMTDAEKEHCKDMAPEDKLAFLNKKPEEKEKEVAKRAEGDESVVIEGQTIKKSAVGEGTFLMMKAQAARIAKTEENLAKEKDARETAEFEKQADEKYAHVPGTTEERGAILKAVTAMDEPLRKSFEKVLEQSEKLAKAGFEKIGHGGGREPAGSGQGREISKTVRDFDAKVNEIKKRDNCKQTDALAKARKEAPELFKAYQEEGEAAN